MGGGGEDSFIVPLGLLLGPTAIIALLLSYAKQSTIIAFIAVGIAVNSFGVVIETTTLGHFSEVGILILLFMAGLEVELEAFIKKWKTVTIIGVGQIVCSTGFFALASFVVLPAIGAEVTVNAAVYFGLCMCFSSTILVLGYLKNSKSMGTVYGQLCLGTLVLQDAASVLGIAVLSGLATGTGTCAQVDPVDCQSVESGAACTALGSNCVFTNSTGGDATSFLCADACASLDLSAADDGGLAMCNALGSAVCMFQEAEEGGGAIVSILVLFAKLIGACIICFLLERYVLEKMFEQFARSLELLYLGSLGYATGLAAIAVLAGFSGEITAFLAGVSIAQLPYKMHIETKMEPIKSLGVAIFFISLGLGLEVNQKMLEALPIGLGLAVFTLFATLPLFMLLGVLAKLKAHNVFMLGLLMNQISEFSLILCTLCVKAKVFEPIVLTVMTVAAVVSIIFSSIGHIFVDVIYQKVQRWWCFRYIDEHYRRGFTKKHEQEKESKVGMTEIPVGTTDVIQEDHIQEDVIQDEFDPDMVRFKKLRASDRAASLLRFRPGGLEDDDWAFENQLKDRSTEQLQIDSKKTANELEENRESMVATADEKRLHFEKTKKQLYGNAGRKVAKDSSRGAVIETSDMTDIQHGMIEGYVIIDRELMFCTLRAGRMLFWREQHDVGHTPPMSVWDISGMAILNMDTEERPSSARSLRPSSPRAAGPFKRRLSATRSSTGLLRQKTGSFMQRPSTAPASKSSPSHFSDSDSDDEEKVHPWEWTIVLGHIHRHTGTSSIEDDTMKLTIHGLEDQSDHDAQDWQDALAVATARLNPIALRLAHIREELHIRKKTEGTLTDSYVEGRKAAHSHRNEIICIGYNEMFPAVLALADAVHKQVVVVEYDPMKINAVKKLYNEEKRMQDYKDKKSGKQSLVVVKGQTETFVGKLTNGTESGIKGVKCEYADVHDPECWEELEMDQAFMLVCTMKGARHAEKAMMKWLQKHKSDTIFIACTHNNVEAIQLYKAGAHFVMQTDALAMRSTRQIFMETVANVGDCSQLVAAGQAHKKRLVKLEKEDHLKFQYETG